jgi:hypothetical protein
MPRQMIEKLGEDGATFVHERLQAGRARHGRRSVHRLHVGDSPSSPGFYPVLADR